MLTTEHIVIILTVGVLLSASLALVVEWIVKRTRWGAKHAEWAKKWLPVVAGVPLGLFGFPLVYSQVVTEVPLLDPRWLAFGAFLGVVGGTGAWFAHDLAKAVLAKVAS